MEELAKKITNYLRKKLSQRAKEIYAEEKKITPYSHVITFCDLTDKQVVHLTRIIELILKGKKKLIYNFDKLSEEINYFETFPTMYFIFNSTFFYEDKDFFLKFSVASLMSNETTFEYVLNSTFTDLIFKIKDKLSKNTK